MVPSYVSPSLQRLCPLLGKDGLVTRLFLLQIQDTATSVHKMGYDVTLKQTQCHRGIQLSTGGQQQAETPTAADQGREKVKKQTQCSKGRAVVNAKLFP